MKRTEARELLFTLLYEAQFSDPGNFDEIYRTELRCRGIEDDEYVRRVFYGIGENLTEIDGIIECHAKGWKSGRLSRVTCAILRLCIYELKYEKDIPMNVSLNEAVELAKKYGEDKAAGFINGILNCIAHEIED